MNEKQTAIMTLAKQELPQLKSVLSLNTKAGVDVETLALQEIEYLQTIGMATPAIFECIPQTVVAAVKSVLKQNLTLDPYAGLVYVKTRNVKVGDQWVKALEIQPSANGLISIARQCGRILDIDRPEVSKDASGKVVAVKVKYLVPSFDETGKKCARWKEVEFDESDFYRWQRASHNENSRGKQDANANTFNYANPNYTNFKGGIDPEFARAKAIRHSLKKLGTNQNETRSVQIVLPAEIKQVVEPAADQAAATDEPNAGGYTQYEDVTPVNQSATPKVEILPVDNL